MVLREKQGQEVGGGGLSCVLQSQTPRKKDEALMGLGDWAGHPMWEGLSSFRFSGQEWSHCNHSGAFSSACFRPSMQSEV